MSARDLSTLSIPERVIAGRAVIQVIRDLRYAVEKGSVLDVEALNKYEGFKLGSLKIQGLEEGSRLTTQAEGSKR